MKLLFLLFSIMPLLSMAASPEIIITDNMIGKMKIEKGMKISLHSISNNFPRYRVRQEISEGEAGSFHSFKVSTFKGEELFEFVSNIEKEEEFEQSLVELDEIVVYGETIKDQYGVHPGMILSDVAKKRNSMNFGHGYMDDYHLGNAKIWYVFRIDFRNVEQPSGFKAKDYALKSKTKVDIISWPAPTWR